MDAPDLRIVSDDLWFGVQRRIKTNLTPGAPAGGRPPRYLLSGIARCAQCGGPMTAINGKVGSATVKAYTCAYHRDRGATVCDSSLRRFPKRDLLGHHAAQIILHDCERVEEGAGLVVAMVRNARIQLAP